MAVKTAIRAAVRVVRITHVTILVYWAVTIPPRRGPPRTLLDAAIGEEP